MLSIILAFFMSIGDTSYAPLFRVGISLEEHISPVVSVAEGEHYNLYIPYSTEHGIIAAVNPVQERLYVVAKNSGLYYTSELSSGKWESEAILRKFLGTSERVNSTNGIVFIKKTPVVRSVWYIYGSYGIIRMISNVPNIGKMILYLEDVPINYLVAIPGSDTSIIAISNDTIMEVSFVSSDSAEVRIIDTINGAYKLWSTSSSVFAAGDSGLYRVYPVYDNSPLYTGKVNSLVERAGVLYSATEEGVLKSSDGGSTWEQYLFDGKPIEMLGLREDTLIIVPESDSAVYYNLSSSSSYNVYAIWPKYFYKIGATKVYQILTVNDEYLTFATDVGPFIPVNGKLMNMAGGTPDKLYFDNVSTFVVDTFISLFNSFSDSVYKKLQPIISDYGLSLPQKINVLIYPIKQFVDNQNNFVVDYLPFYGYAQTSNIDSILTNIVGINAQPEFQPTWPWVSYLDLTPDLQKTILAYNFAKLSVMIKLPNERQPLITAIAEYLTQKAGYNLTKGFVVDNIEFETNYNQPLLSGSQHHPDALDVREVDRERLFYFIEFLSEYLGDDVIRRLISLPETYTGYNRLEMALDTISLSECLNNWAIKNVMGRYQVDSTFKVVPSSAPIVQPLYNYATFYLSIDSNREYSMDISNDIPAEDFYVGLVQDTTYHKIVFTDTTRNYKRFSSSTSNRVVVLTNSTPNIYYVSFSEDIIPPDTPRLYIIQNPGFVATADFYIYGSEELYNDVGNDINVRVPEILFESEDTTYTYKLNYFTYGDSSYVYRLHSYFPIMGNFLVKARAQDVYGNEIITKGYPISIFTIEGSGKYVLFNGRVVLHIPELLNPKGIKLVCTYNTTSDEVSFTLGSNSIKFSEKVKLSIKVPRKWQYVNVFRWENGTWNKIETVVNKDGVANVFVKTLGTFKVKKSMEHFAEDNPVTEAGIYINGISTSKLSFTVSVESGFSSGKVMLFDASGRMVKRWNMLPHKHMQKFEYSVSSKGVYYIVVDIDGKVYNKRAVVVR